ncbi:MAG: hypothetical protein R3E92_02385 [Burkholderiaceae bacterium]
MRKTSFHLDQESTIISMLTLGGSPEVVRSASRPAALKVWIVLAGVVAALGLAYLVGGWPQ